MKVLKVRYLESKKVLQNKCRLTRTVKSKERDKSILKNMYNVCTIMYIHMRSQASDWNCSVKRLFVCAQQSTSLTLVSPHQSTSHNSPHPLY